MSVFNSTVLLLLSLISCTFARPIQDDDTIPEHCTFKWGNVQLLKFSCIQDAILQTKGMYLNLVRTFDTPDGPIMIAIDRPNNHGEIYAFPSVDPEVSASNPDGTIYKSA